MLIKQTDENRCFVKKRLIRIHSDSCMTRVLQPVLFRLSSQKT